MIQFLQATLYRHEEWNKASDYSTIPSSIKQSGLANCGNAQDWTKEDGSW